MASLQGRKRYIFRPFIKDIKLTLIMEKEEEEEEEKKRTK